MSSPIIDDLISSLRCLPGVGPKSAQRMAFYLLQKNKAGAEHLANCLKTALKNIRCCERCRTLTDTRLCNICTNPNRDESLLCLVENPVDIFAIEHTKEYNGYYFVLQGRLSPLDGVGPEELGLSAFRELLKLGSVKEVIMATNLTVEGETTAYYFAEVAKEYGVATSRIAQGVPLGGELEHVDAGTLARALWGRGLISK